MMNNHPNDKNAKLIHIYLPVLTVQELREADHQLASLTLDYDIPHATCHQILKDHLGIFDRLIRIDPVLRRVKSQSDRPFVTTEHCPTKSEAKSLLRHIHACLDRCQMPVQQRRIFLRALNVEGFRVYARVQAEAELRVLQPTAQ